MPWSDVAVPRTNVGARAGSADNRRAVRVAEISLSTPSPNPRRIAENSLWHALEERCEQVGRAGLKYSPRQYAQLKQAHEDGDLIAQLCGAMEGCTGKGDPYYLEAMARVHEAISGRSMSPSARSAKPLVISANALRIASR